MRRLLTLRDQLNEFTWQELTRFIGSIAFLIDTMPPMVNLKTHPSSMNRAITCLKFMAICAGNEFVCEHLGHYRVALFTVLTDFMLNFLGL